MGVCCLDIPGVLQYRALAIQRQVPLRWWSTNVGISVVSVFRFGFWMTFVLHLVALVAALRTWAAVGEPWVRRLESERAAR